MAREKLYWKLFNRDEFWNEMHSEWTDRQRLNAIQQIYLSIEDFKFDKKIQEFIEIHKD